MRAAKATGRAQLVNESIEAIKEQLQRQSHLRPLGGVDSRLRPRWYTAPSATSLPAFVNNGLLRREEAEARAQHLPQ
jgi:GMP synthase PP-ATPase subunit